MSLSKLHIHHLDSVDSTNSRLKEMIRSRELPDRYVLYADYQEHGRGTGGNSWESEAGKNLLCSIFTRNPGNVGHSVTMSSGTALAVVSTLQEYGIEARIKWPNDVMVGDKKIAGVLIENSLAGDKIQHSIAGIGLNINQGHFRESNATSMHILTGLDYSVEEVLHKLITNFMELGKQPNGATLAMVNTRLFKKNEVVAFSTLDGEHSFKVLSINNDGSLRVEDEGKELELVYGQWKWKKDFV